MNKFDTILQKFCGEKDGLRPELETPFNYPGIENIYATDACCLVVIPMHLCSEDYETRTKPNAPGVIPESDRRIPLSITKMKSLINEIPTVDGPEIISCNKCLGDGFLEEFDGNRVMEYNCPECDGTGVKTGGNVSQKDSEYCIKIGENHWNLFILEKLIWAADQLEVETVFLKNPSSSLKPDLYEVGDIEIMIMPRLEASEKILTYHI